MTLNRKAREALEQLQRRYASEQQTATLHEVEVALAGVEKLTRRQPAGFWPWSDEPCISASRDVDDWIVKQPGMVVALC